MKKIKVATIVGTRPEIIRLSEVIKACDKYFNHKLIHTGQNWDYNLNQVFFDELELREPDYYLNVAVDRLGETIGNIISKSYDVLLEEKPDALLLLGDTNSCLAAISAKRLKIPIFHMEAGNRCFDMNVPEEINRRIVDHVSDINLPYTEHSRRYLLDEGIKKEHIFVTSSPMGEVLTKYKGKILASNVLEKLSLESKGYIVLSAHREENIDLEQNFFRLMNSINDIAEHYKKKVIYSVHPRSMKKINESGFKFHDLVVSMPPFGFFDYNKLQKESFVVISDSGTLAEESSILNFAGVLIRTSTERPEVIDKGRMVIGGISSSQIINAIDVATSFACDDITATLPSDYIDKNVSEKIVKIILSYYDIINRGTWGK